jgi:anti-anti-sigma factor
MGAAGLTLLLRLRDHLHLGGGTLRLAAAPPAVLRLIALTALQDFLPCWRDVAGAADHTTSGPG